MKNSIWYVRNCSLKLALKHAIIFPLISDFTFLNHFPILVLMPNSQVKKQNEHTNLYI